VAESVNEASNSSASGIIMITMYAVAACIAMEIRAGRTREEAEAVCYERIKNRIARGSHPPEGK